MTDQSEGALAPHGVARKEAVDSSTQEHARQYEALAGNLGAAALVPLCAGPAADPASPCARRVRVAVTATLSVEFVSKGPTPHPNSPDRQTIPSAPEVC